MARRSGKTTICYPKEELKAEDAGSTLASTNDLHLLRKLWHVLGGTAIALSYEWWLSWGQCSALLGILFLCLVLVEVGKSHKSNLSTVVLKISSPLLRKHEVTGLSGSFYFMFGCLVVVLLFPKYIAVLSILLLSVGDPIASAVGIFFGQSFKLSNGKSLLV
ncbi:Diacylglycerol kinase [Balamuthia mandrillaris]